MSYVDTGESCVRRIRVQAYSACVAKLKPARIRIRFFVFLSVNRPNTINTDNKEIVRLSLLKFHKFHKGTDLTRFKKDADSASRFL